MAVAPLVTASSVRSRLRGRHEPCRRPRAATPDTPSERPPRDFGHAEFHEPFLILARPSHVGDHYSPTGSKDSYGFVDRLISAGPPVTHTKCRGNLARAKAATTRSRVRQRPRESRVMRIPPKVIRDGRMAERIVPPSGKTAASMRELKETIDCRLIRHQKTGSHACLIVDGHMQIAARKC